MEFVVADESGLCKELSWLSEGTRRTRILKKAKQSRSLAVTALCWSGPSGGREASELAVGRACGTVEAFAASGIVCGAPLSTFLPSGEGDLDVPLRSFQLPSTPVTLSLIGSDAARANTRSLLCKSWLGSDVTPQAASLREALQPPSDTTEGLLPGTANSSSLLLAVGQKGHACVVEWEGSFSARLLEQRNGKGEGVVVSDCVASEDVAHVPMYFKPIGKEPLAGTAVEEWPATGDSCCFRAAYLLPGPVEAASNHPFCRSLLAIGGKDNDAKVVDLDYGKLLWAAKNVKPSFLGVQSEVAVTQLDWVLSLHPMILATGNARGALRFYDLRCQRRPVLELCDATQERRPVTALCVRPADEVLQRHMDMRVALANAAETVASAECRKCTAESSEQKKGARGPSHVTQKEASQGSPSHKSDMDSEAEKAASDLLASCSGKESAVVYYADSHGMVYGLRVVSGSTLLRLADRTCPKYNSSSYRSLEERPPAEKSPEEKRKLIFAMLEKQRQRLSSKKNDHPIAVAANPDLQLAAIPKGGFKGPVGAVAGLALDPAGERLIAVGLDRHAYVFDAKSRKLCGKAFLRQKLTTVLAGAGEAAGGVRRCSKPEGGDGGASTKGATDTAGHGLSSDADNSGPESETSADSDKKNLDASDARSIGSSNGSAEYIEDILLVPGKLRRPLTSVRVKRKRAPEKSQKQKVRC